MSTQEALLLAKYSKPTSPKRSPRKKGANPSMRPQLHKVCASGDVVLLRRLLGKGGATFSPNRVDTQDGATPVHIACKHGHLETLKMLLQERDVGSVPGDMHLRTNAGNTVLHLIFVAARGHVDILEYLLDNFDEEDGVDYNSRNSSGNTPLLLAAHHNMILAVEQLVVRLTKQNIDMQNMLGETALLAAATKGYVGIVRYLILEGKANTEKTNRSGFTALGIAALKGHLRTVHILIEFGADVEARNVENGNSVLHNACWRGHTDVAALIIKAGVDLNKRNLKGNSPLHCGSFRGHTRIIKLLLATAISAAAPSATKKLKVTPAQIQLDGSDVTLYTLRPAQKTVVLGMLDNVNTAGNTPLHAACFKGHLFATQCILLFTTAHGLCKKNTALNTPLHAACFSGSVPIVRLLLSRGAESCLHMKNEKGNSPLQASCIKEHYDLTELLVTATKEVAALPALRLKGSTKNSLENINVDSRRSERKLPPLELKSGTSAEARYRRRRLAEAAKQQKMESDRRIKEAETELYGLLEKSETDLENIDSVDDNEANFIDKAKASATEFLLRKMKKNSEDVRLTVVVADGDENAAQFLLSSLKSPSRDVRISEFEGGTLESFPNANEEADSENVIETKNDGNKAFIEERKNRELILKSKIASKACIMM